MLGKPSPGWPLILVALTGPRLRVEAVTVVFVAREIATMQNSILRYAWAAGALCLAIGGAAQINAAATPVQLSVLTYNVHALPWPLAGRRDADLAAMANRLRAMRMRGVQPRVVALQEAFTDRAKAIGALAGYRYVRFGPLATSAVPALDNGQDQAFQTAASFLHGERAGKQVDSGLAIFSDYPILAARQIVYPLCAGFDCLAAKGALAVRLAVPGVTQPVMVLDTHLNANRAAGVSNERTLYAYRRQLDLLDRFIGNAVPASAALFLAGDFNVGQNLSRRAYFTLWRYRSVGGLASAMARHSDWTSADRQGLGESARHGKDWLMYRAPQSLAVIPLRLAAPFARSADGRMLSDHVGISATYRLDWRDLGKRVVTIAVR